MTAWLFLALGIALTAGTALFVAAEFSLVSLDRPTVERAVESGDAGAEPVLVAVRSLSTQLSGAQVGITVTTLIVGYLVEPSLATLISPLLRTVGLSEDVAPAVAVGLGLFLATVFSMIFGELLPQNLGISVPLATAKVIARPQRAFTAATMPLINVLNGSANRFLRLVGVEPQEELSSGRTPEELAALVRRSAQAGTLDEQTATLLTRSLDFSAHTADDVMTPRVQVESVQPDTTAAEVITLARRTGFSRFPVVEQDIDDVVGVVHVKTAVGVPKDRRTEVPVGALMSTVLRVPETMRLDPLLLTLRERGLQLAVVEDEYGGTAGIVTLEDVIEELIGEISDEHDRGRNNVVRRRDGSYWLSGLMRPDEVRDAIGLAVPDGSAYETIGGFVIEELGRLARVGDRVDVPGALLTVERLDGHRIDRVSAVARPVAVAAMGQSPTPVHEQGQEQG